MEQAFDQNVPNRASNGQSSSGDELFVSPESGHWSESGGQQFVFEGTPANNTIVSASHTVHRNGLSVVVPAVSRPWEYEVYDPPYGGLAVDSILQEEDDDDGISYLVRFEDGTEELV